MTVAHAYTLIDRRPAADSFLEDVLSGLSAPARALPPKYFYDARGSELFEAICELPEYYPTRTELALMRDHAPAMAAALGPEVLLLEFGSGAGIKTELLLAALQPKAYVPVDISVAALRAAVPRTAAAFPTIAITAVCADYMKPLALPELEQSGTRRRVIYFPGSTIGNLTPQEALDFLVRMRELAGDGGAMLVGVDLKKDAAVLHAAYNDAQGVTAEFNLNLLRRINRELGADFDVGRFAHVAFYDAGAGRIEMHLESRTAQVVTVAGRRFDFAAGERIHTENSCKYSVEEFRTLSWAAGWRPARCWTDELHYFAVHLLTA